MVALRDEALQDLTNFPDILDQFQLERRSLTDAIKRVLSDDHTAEWIVDMLSLTKYYKVTFKYTNTIHKFIDVLLEFSQHKE